MSDTSRSFALVWTYQMKYLITYQNVFSSSIDDRTIEHGVSDTTF